MIMIILIATFIDIIVIISYLNRVRDFYLRLKLIIIRDIESRNLFHN